MEEAHVLGGGLKGGARLDFWRLQAPRQAQAQGPPTIYGRYLTVGVLINEYTAK